MRPELQIWNVIAKAAIGSAFVFACAVVLIFVIRPSLVPIKKKSNLFLWISFFFLLVVSWFLPGYDRLPLFLGIPVFLLILIVRAFKWGRARELKILLCCAAAASIGNGIYFAYNHEYRTARLLSALDGHLFPEDVTPIPRFDPAVGIPYRDADILPEFGSVVDDTIYARIPIERGFTLENKRSEGDSIYFTLSNHNSQNMRASTTLNVSISLQKNPIDDPSMRKYIEKKYADLDIANILQERRFRVGALYDQRKIIYLSRNAAIILQSKTEEISSQRYKVDGIIGIGNAAYEFSVSSFRPLSGENLPIRNHIADWAYAFIQANREADPPPPADDDAPATLPAQPAGPG